MDLVIEELKDLRADVDYLMRRAAKVNLVWLITTKVVGGTWRLLVQIKQAMPTILWVFGMGSVAFAGGSGKLLAMLEAAIQAAKGAG